MTRYIAITPARDEEKFLPLLIGSMAAQIWNPDRWIIIDDGSADATAAILDEAARTYPWIEPHHLPRNRPRAPGGESCDHPVPAARSLSGVRLVLRLDADVSFEAGFIDLLLEEFAHDPKLGIASPTLWEPTGPSGSKFDSPSTTRAARPRCTRWRASTRSVNSIPTLAGTHSTKRAR